MHWFRIVLRVTSHEKHNMWIFESLVSNLISLRFTAAFRHFDVVSSIGQSISRCSVACSVAKWRMQSSLHVYDDDNVVVKCSRIRHKVLDVRTLPPTYLSPPGPCLCVMIQNSYWSQTPLRKTLSPKHRNLLKPVTSFCTKSSTFSPGPWTMSCLLGQDILEGPGCCPDAYITALLDTLRL